MRIDLRGSARWNGYIRHISDQPDPMFCGLNSRPWAPLGDPFSVTLQSFVSGERWVSFAETGSDVEGDKTKSNQEKS